MFLWKPNSPIENGKQKLLQSAEQRLVRSRKETSDAQSPTCVLKTLDQNAPINREDVTTTDITNLNDTPGLMVSDDITLALPRAVIEIERAAPRHSPHHSTTLAHPMSNRRPLLNPALPPPPLPSPMIRPARALSPLCAVGQIWT